MTLVLTLTNGGGGAGSAKTFDRRGGTIGRNPDNDWVLPDPNRIVGRQHCRIDFDGVAYLLTDVSTNGVFVNGSPTPLGRDRQTILQDGDRLLIGDFQIVVSVRHGAAVPPPLTAGGNAGMGDANDPFGLHEFPEHATPTARVTFDAKKSDAFDDQFQGWGDTPETGGLFDTPAAPPPRPAASPATQADHHPVEMDALNLPPLAAPPPAPAPASYPPDDFGISASVPGLDDLDDFLESLHQDKQGGQAPAPPPTPQPAPTPQPVASFSPPPVHPAPPAMPVAGSDDDPFGLGPETQTPTTSPAPAALSPAAPPTAHLAPPPTAAPAMPPSPPVTPPQPVIPAPAAPTAPPPAGADALQALLQGLGMDARALGHLPPEQFARRAGATLRLLVAGLREVLTARAMARNEFRIKGTVIGAQQNNPLKLAPTPESALRQLVGETEPGYMRPEAALKETIEDLKAHQMAMLAGMQRAIASLLERFEPETLKQQLDHQPMLASILPGARKASYWTTYESVYRKIAAEAAEDFNAVFGREFARAYEEQIDRMRAQARTPQPPPYPPAGRPS